MLCIFGVWRSPVARTHGVREVRSSNLLTPTKNNKVILFFYYNKPLKAKTGSHGTGFSASRAWLKGKEIGGVYSGKS